MAWNEKTFRSKACSHPSEILLRVAANSLWSVAGCGLGLKRIHVSRELSRFSVMPTLSNVSDRQVRFRSSQVIVSGSIGTTISSRVHAFLRKRTFVFLSSVGETSPL